MESKKYLLILILIPLVLKLFIAYTVYDPGNILNPSKDKVGFVNIADFRLMNKLLEKEIDPFDIPIPEGEEYAKIKDGTVWLGYGPLYYLWASLLREPFHFTVKILPIISETIISILLFLMIKRKFTAGTAFIGALIFALNPLSIQFTAIQGQFDMIPILFVFLSYYLRDNKYLSAVCLGIGASFKYFFPLLIAGMFVFRYKEKIKFGLTTTLTMLICYIPFILNGNFFNSIKKQIGYTPQFNWGFAKLFILFNLKPSILVNYGKYILLLALIVFLIIQTELELRQAYLIMFYSFYFFTMFIHPIYFLWIVPFLFIDLREHSIWFLIMCTLHIFFLHSIRYITTGLNLTFSYTWYYSALSFIFGVLTWIACFKAINSLKIVQIPKNQWRF